MEKITRREFLVATGLAGGALAARRAIAVADVIAGEQAKEKIKWIKIYQPRIYFKERKGTENEVWVMDDNGTNLKQITNNCFRESFPTISPDGEFLAFSQWDDPHIPAGWIKEHIYITNIYANHTVLLEGDKEKSYTGPLVWSPDSKLLAGVIRYGQLASGPKQLTIFNLDGGIERVVNSDLGSVGNPNFSPDGKHVIYESSGVIFQDKRVIIGNPKDRNAYRPALSKNGDRLVYLKLLGKNKYFPVLFNIKDGSQKPLIPDVYYIRWDPYAARSVPEPSSPDDDNQTPMPDNPCSWSPDGRQIALKIKRNGSWNIYILNPESGETTQVTRDIKLTPYWFPAYWSPDGKKLVFELEEQLPFELEEGEKRFIAIINRDGTNLSKLLVLAEKNDKSDDNIVIAYRWEP